MDFEQIYNQYFQDVYYYILRLSGNESIAEEITSETFFKALSAIDKFRGECELRVWLCQIAKNAYYSYIKKHKRTVSRNDEDFALIEDCSPTVHDKIEQASKAEQIRKIVHTLQEPYKEVFIWRVFAEMNFKQIAQIFGKNANWACVTYHRAKKMIAEKIQKQNKEEK